MSERTSRFVGFAAAFVASTLAPFALPSAQAQVLRAGGLDATAMRAGVSGVVRDRGGRPQIGAVVELLDAQYGVVARTFTDDRGHYALPRLRAGVYQLKATSATFLPTIQNDLRLLAHSKLVVDMTLSTLYQALDWLPAEPRAQGSSAEDWDWTLRLSANRPLLRMLEPGDAASLMANEAARSGEIAAGRAWTADGPVVIQGSGDRAGAATSRRLSVRSGTRQFGQGGMAEQVAWQGHPEDGRGLVFTAQTAATPTGLDRISTTAAYRQELTSERSMTTIVTFTDRGGIRRVGSGNGTLDGSAAGLVTVRMRSASSVHLGDLAQVDAGTELVGARLGTGPAMVAGHPFAALTVHAGQSTVAYRVATARTMANAADIEAAASDDSPALSAVHGVVQLEQGLHQELRVSRRGARWSGEVAVFDDRVDHPVVEGAVPGAGRGPLGDGEAALDTDNVLYDPGTGTIAVSGAGYHHGGVLAMLRDQLSPDTWISLRYAMGEAVTMPAMPGPADFAEAVRGTGLSPMAAIAAGTRIGATGTVLRGSYRWQPVGTLTGVAPFESGTPDAYLGLSIRQPLHLARVGPGRVQAILDVRNLLAEGYRPFVSQDGSTVYFAQSQRCIAGGVAFSF